MKGIKNMATYNNANTFDVQKQYSTYEFILNGIIERVKNYLEEQNVEYGENEIDQVYNFLAPHIDGKVWVECEFDFPDSNDYYYTNIAIGTSFLKLACSKCPQERKFPYSLYVKVVKDYEHEFRELWRKNYFPTILLEDAIKLLDLSKHIDIRVYEYPGPWLNMFNKAKNPVVFGQNFNYANDDFNAARPIGFVDGNFLAITSPNERMDFEIALEFN